MNNLKEQRDVPTIAKNLKLRFPTDTVLRDLISEVLCGSLIKLAPAKVLSESTDSRSKVI